MNLAARAGNWSAAHWKTATFGWLALVVATIAIGSAAGTVMLTNSEDSVGESAHAAAVLDRAFPDHAGEAVLVQSKTRTAAEPAFKRELNRVVTGLRELGEVQSIRSPLTRGHLGQISKEGHSALVEFEIKGPSDTAAGRVQPVLDAVAALDKASPFKVAEFGDASADRELSKSDDAGIKKAERLSLPITFVVLLIAFGAFVAAGLPVLLAFSAVLASGGLAAIASHVVHASDSTSSVMLLMGMAVGVDYSLFYLKREREEKWAGHTRDSVQRAAATSGRAVLVSGLTVLIAMAGMLFAGTNVFRSIGVGAMLVVLMALIGSMTVLPALLARLGDKVEKGRIRGAGRSTSRIWDAVLKPVLRFPAVAAVLSTAALVLMALPVLGLHTTLPGLGDMPQGIPIVKTYERIQHAFPGAQTPAQVAIEADDVTSPEMKAALAALERRALASGQARPPFHTAINASHSVAHLEVPLVGSGEDKRSMQALRILRSDLLPQTIGQVRGARYAVTGETAGAHDFNAATKHAVPIVFAFVLGLAFMLLLITFRSLVIPLVSIALNLLSVGAAYGILVWIFQRGHLEGLLGFHSNGAIATWLPLFLFAVLFGLSMDYHVFIVSRIKEMRDGGASTSDAVAQGIRTTASTVTAAAAVMVAVFAVFASLPRLDIKQLGVGLALAVMLDATLIRGVLLPATMKMLGDWNWYLPRWLGWLPRVNVQGGRRQPAAEAA